MKRKTLHELLPFCQTKDTHDFPDLTNGERCWNCELWEAIEEYANNRRANERSVHKNPPKQDG